MSGPLRRVGGVVPAPGKNVRPTGTLRRRAGVVHRTLGSEVLALHPEVTEVLRLEGSAVAVWLNLDGPGTAHQLAGRILADLDGASSGDLASVEKAVHDGISVLLRFDLVTSDDDT